MRVLRECAPAASQRPSADRLSPTERRHDKQVQAGRWGRRAARRRGGLDGSRGHGGGAQRSLLHASHAGPAGPASCGRSARGRCSGGRAGGALARWGWECHADGAQWQWGVGPQSPPAALLHPLATAAHPVHSARGAAALNCCRWSWHSSRSARRGAGHAPRCTRRRASARAACQKTLAKKRSTGTAAPSVPCAPRHVAPRTRWAVERAPRPLV
jgi:hypothetical protein